MRTPNGSTGGVALVMGMVLSCTGPADIAGVSSGGETSTVSGYVLSGDGAPAQGAGLILCRADHVTLPGPGSAAGTLRAVADSQGRFIFPFVQHGAYRLEADHTPLGAVTDLLVPTVQRTAEIVVKRRGAIDGRVTHRPGALWVQVFGLDRIAAVDQTTGAFVIQDIPAGTFVLRIVGANEQAYTPDTVHGIVHGAGDTTTVLTGLPPGWSCGSVGDEEPRGSAAMVDGDFVVSGGGPDIWGTADGFHMVWIGATGDGGVLARLADFDRKTPFTKAGIMYRGVSGASAPFVALCYEGSTNTTPGNSGVVSISRPSEGFNVDSAAVAVEGTALPVWLRVEREGLVYTTAVSADGQGWTVLSSDTVDCGLEPLVGMCVTSHSTTVTTSAVFDSVAVW